MKTSLLLMLRFLPLTLTLLTCQKDSEETYYDEDQDYIDVHYGKNDKVTKEMSIENWEMFLKQAQTTFDLTETNLRSLAIASEDASGDERDKLKEIHQRLTKNLREVRKSMDSRNLAFQKELRHYDQKIQPRNEAFKKQFKQQMFDINIELENILEDN